MVRLSLAVLVQLLVSFVYADNSMDEELSYLYGEEDFVSIATGRKQLITDAPAVASVITAKDIMQMGAQDLSEVLESVPGLHVSVTHGAYNPVFGIRGIRSDFNPQVLFLINGFPITNIHTGDRGRVWGGMPVKNIARIEVVRGPGSASFGADALAGVVNIITKSADDIDGLEVGSAYGSFNTKRGWFLYGGRVQDWDVSLGVEFVNTDGLDAKIIADEQTNLDVLFGTSASFAPGDVNVEKKGVEARFEMSNKTWGVRAGYQGWRDVGTGAGGAQALDPVGDGKSDRLNFDVTYHKEGFVKDWDISSSFSYFETAMEIDLVLLPPGAFGVFPDGMIGNPDVYERHYRFDTSAFYSGIDDHKLRFGVGYHYLDQYRVEENKNFDLTMGPVPVDLGSVRSVGGDAIFNEEKAREVTYFFVQDEWSITSDWSVVSGMRYDHFSDFGGALNPRLALIFSEGNLTSKLLYGRAFRAPSFAEQFNKNNPIIVGNDDLDPETIDTYELAFDYAYTPDMRAGLNLFYYKMEDIIQFTPVAMNTGSQTGKGFELEFDWQMGERTLWSANYAFQRSRDKEAGKPAANSPEHQLFVRLDQQLSPKWYFGAKLNSVMNRRRASGDTRKEIDDYVTLDLILTGKELLPGVTASVSIFNVTDEDVREPSLYDPLTNSVAIPNDLPQADRSFVATIQKSW